MINIVIRNIGRGAAKEIKFLFSAPIESSAGQVISDAPYFKEGIAFLAPNTEIATVWDSYAETVEALKNKGLRNGITVTARYKDLRGKAYSTSWTLNPLVLEGSGYADYREFEDQVRALEKISDDLRSIREVLTSRDEPRKLTDTSYSQEPADGNEDPIHR